MSEPLADPVAPPAEEKKKATEYVILYASSATSKGWSEGARVKGHGAENAIRNYLKEAENSGGAYVAVPARSWKPLTPQIETQTKLKFS